MSVYFNEHDKFAAQWLRNLWPDATVDERDIQDVKPEDVMGFERVHFFAGIGGWQYALDLAGFAGPVWTGSCPCQSLSCAGRRQGEKDERHLWPEFYRLISECRPAIVFGEQVTSGDGREWLDGISLDLEELAYAVGASDLCAASAGAPHPRQRLYWSAFGQLGDTDGARLGARGRSQRGECGEAVESVSAAGSESLRMEYSAGDGRDEGRAQSDWGHADATRAHSGLADAAGVRSAEYVNDTRERTAGSEADAADRLGLSGLEFSVGDGQRGERTEDGRKAEASWASEVISCRDGRARRISAQSGDEPLAHGIPRDLGRRFPELRQLAKGARANRVGRLKGYGNSIVPQVAAMFIRAAMEATAPGA